MGNRFTKRLVVAPLEQNILHGALEDLQEKISEAYMTHRYAPVFSLSCFVVSDSFCILYS
jgi:hypothetical protein